MKYRFLFPGSKIVEEIGAFDSPEKAATHLIRVASGKNPGKLSVRFMGANVHYTSGRRIRPRTVVLLP